MTPPIEPALSVQLERFTKTFNATWCCHFPSTQQTHEKLLRRILPQLCCNSIGSANRLKTIPPSVEERLVPGDQTTLAVWGYQRSQAQFAAAHR